VQPSWTTVPCPTTKLGLLISKSFIRIKQSVISIASKTPLKTRLGIGIYKTSLQHRPDGVIVFTSRCPVPTTFYNKIAPMRPHKGIFFHFDIIPVWPAKKRIDWRVVTLIQRSATQPRIATLFERDSKPISDILTIWGRKQKFLKVEMLVFCFCTLRHSGKSLG